MNTKNFFEGKKPWSRYKDKLLADYLPLYFSKILATGRDTIFIDGFAGRGIFDDGTIGSPIIVRDKVNEALGKTHFSSRIYPIFIEYNKKYADELKTALNDNSCYVINGDYKEIALQIIKKYNDCNIFLYADPFGIKHLHYSIFSTLAQNRNSVELLINMNSFGFIREGCRLFGAEIDAELEQYAELDDSISFVNDIENMNEIAGGDYWQDIIKAKKEGLITAKEAEDKFVANYIKVLGEDFEYIFQFAIKTGDNNIPKYRMIFATNHIHGALYMSENMIKCNNNMILENHGQQSTFFDYEFTKINCAEDIATLLFKIKETECKIDCKDLCLLSYTVYGPKYLHSDIKTALTQLEKSKCIKLIRDKPYTPTGKISRSMDFINNKITVEIL